ISPIDNASEPVGSFLRLLHDRYLRFSAQCIAEIRVQLREGRCGVDASEQAFSEKDPVAKQHQVTSFFAGGESTEPPAGESTVETQRAIVGSPLGSTKE